MQQLLAQKEKAQKEENLRLLAQRAREERNGITPAVTGSSSAGAAIKAPVEVGVNLGGYGSESEEDASDEEDEAVQEREQVRAEKRKEREKEMRMSNMGTEMRAKMLAKWVILLSMGLITDVTQGAKPRHLGEDCAWPR